MHFFQHAKIRVLWLKTEMRRVCKNAIFSHSNMSSMQEKDISVVDLIYTVRTQKPSMFVFTLLNALSYFHFLFQVQIKTWFLYTSRTSFEISKQTCMYSYTNILSTLLLTYILQCKNKQYSSFVIMIYKVYLKIMNMPWYTLYFTNIHMYWYGPFIIQ